MLNQTAKQTVSGKSYFSSVSRLKETKVLTFCGMMGALSVILGYVATIKFGQYIRIGFSGLPTSIVVGAFEKDIARYVQNVFMNNVFRVYISPDMLGIEIGAALKNVIALAAGMADGYGLGDNAKAALITRGIAEIGRLGMAMGGKFETFSGLSGIGDLVVTCASMHSRNRRAGILIGQGKTYQEAMDEVHMVVEGVYSAKAALKLAQKYEVEMPIVQAVNDILFNNKAPGDALNDLMLRDKKIENNSLDW